MQKLNRRDLLLSLGSSGILALAGSIGYRPRPIFGQATCTLTPLTLSIAANAATEFVSWVPVVLSSSGLAGSVYTSELAITNRAATAAAVGFSYTAASGGGSGSVSGALV